MKYTNILKKSFKFPNKLFKNINFKDNNLLINKFHQNKKITYDLINIKLHEYGSYKSPTTYLQEYKSSINKIKKYNINNLILLPNTTTILSACSKYMNENNNNNNNDTNNNDNNNDMYIKIYILISIVVASTWAYRAYIDGHNTEYICLSFIIGLNWPSILIAQFLTFILFKYFL